MKIKISSHWTSCILIVLAGFALYSNTFSVPLQFDDFAAILDNPFIRNFWDLPAIWNAFNTRFVVGVTLAFNYALGGLNVAGYHLFNIATHALSACLVYVLAALTLKDLPEKDRRAVAIFAAFIFLVHPIQTEAVTYIWQRAASLAAVFYLASLVFYIRSRRENSRVSYAASLLCAILAMFSKEISITLPMTIVVYEFFFLREKGERAKKGFFYLVPFLLTTLIIPLMLLRAPHITLGLMKPYFGYAKISMNPFDLTRFVSQRAMPRSTYILTQIHVLRTYLRLLLLPIHQNVDYDYPLSRGFFDPATFSSFFLLAAVFFLGILLFKKQRLMAFGIFWFFLTLSVESFVPQKDVIFEHRLYLPMVGYSLFLAGAVHGISVKLRKPRIFFAMLLAFVSFYSALTYQRNALWKDELTLWEDAIKNSPHKARPYFNRGNVLLRRHLVKESLPDFDKAIEYDPTYDEPYYNRANIYRDLGYPEKAMKDYDKAIECNPNFDKALNNRGALFVDRRDYQNALRDFEMALKINPGNQDALRNKNGLINYLRKYGNGPAVDSSVSPLFLEAVQKASHKQAAP